MRMKLRCQLGPASEVALHTAGKLDYGQEALVLPQVDLSLGLLEWLGDVTAGFPSMSGSKERTGRKTTMSLMTIRFLGGHNKVPPTR
jgi:hypothetical protein